MGMEHISNGISKRFNRVINVNNDNSVVNTNDNNVIPSKGKYALDKTKFKPNTEESQLAERLSEYFNDLDNFAFYYSVVKRLGVDRAYSFWRNVTSEIEEKKETKYEIRSPKKYFAWRYQKGLF